MWHFVEFLSIKQSLQNSLHLKQQVRVLCLSFCLSHIYYPCISLVVCMQNGHISQNMILYSQEKKSDAKKLNCFVPAVGSAGTVLNGNCAGNIAWEWLHCMLFYCFHYKYHNVGHTNCSIGSSHHDCDELFISLVLRFVQMKQN